MTPREGRFQPDFDGAYARDKTLRREHTTPTGFPAAPTASGMQAWMIEKQPGQWDHIVIVKRCVADAVGTVDGQRLRSVKTAAKLMVIGHPMRPVRVWHAA